MTAEKFAVNDKYLGFGVIELKGNGLRIEPCVDGVQHCAGHRNAMVGFKHCGCVRQHHRNGIALADPCLDQRICQPLGAFQKRGIADPQRAVNDRDMIRVDQSCPLKMGQRCQRLVVRFISVKIGFIRICAHASGPVRAAGFI
jgi:hypothetical protein